MKHDGFVQHLKDRRPDVPEKSMDEIKAEARKQKAEKLKNASQSVSRAEKLMEKQEKAPGGEKQTGSAAEARAAMIERQQEKKEPEYTTPAEAYDIFMREPSPETALTAAQARERMIQRMTERDGSDKSCSMARREPSSGRGDAGRDTLLAACMRDVYDAYGNRISKRPTQGSAAAQAREKMIRRLSGK